MKLQKLFLLTAGAFLALNNANAYLFFDDFDYAAPLTNAAPGYTVQRSHTDSRIIFGYDYSVPDLGIPSAPNSIGGSQLGVRFDANISLGNIVSVVISPNQSFAGDFTLKFDLWLNTLGPFPGGGAGSTEHITAGVGYNGSTFQNATSGSGVWFAASNEGGSSGTSAVPDFHARVGTTLQATNSGVYAAGTTPGSSGSSVDHAHPYYTSKFPGQTPPSVQTNLFSSQTGTLNNGTLGFKWHEVEISRTDNVVTWMIDGFLIATVTNNAAIATDQAFVGYWDAFSSIAGTTGGSAGSQMVFGLIDNLMIVPEPSTAAVTLLGLAVAACCARRKKR
jgi:hypothetical protein